MTEQEQAGHYLELKCGAYDFWRWAPDRAGIVWADGSMVATREELVAILRRLQATGLPPFGAIVQLVAACRGKTIAIQWREPSEDEGKNLRKPCITVSAGRRVPQWQRVRLFGTPESISAAALWLEQLPREFKKPLEHPRALPELAALLLGESGRPGPADEVINLLAEGRLVAQTLNNPFCHYKYPTVLEDLARLGRALDALSWDEIHARLEAALGGEELRRHGARSFVTIRPVAFCKE